MAKTSKAAAKRAMMAEMTRLNALTPEQREAEFLAKVAASHAIADDRIALGVSEMKRQMSTVVSVGNIGREAAAQSAEDMGLQGEADRIRVGGAY